MIDSNTLDKTQRRNGSLESTRQLQIEPVHKIQQNLLTDRQEVREPYQIFINKKQKEKQSSVSVKKSKERYRESKHTKDQKTKALSQKTYAAPKKESMKKKVEPAVLNSATSASRKQRMGSQHTEEQQQVLDDIKQVNINIENLYENIKNSDRKSSQRKLRTDPRVYGSAEARKLANEQYGNIKVNPMQTDDLEPEVVDTKTFDILKNAQNQSKKQEKYGIDEPKNSYGLAPGHQLYGITSRGLVSESQQQPVLVSTFDQQNAKFDQNTTTKKVANLKNNASNYTEIVNPGIQYKIPQFQLTKHVENFDDKQSSEPSQLRSKNQQHVYQNEASSEPNFITTVRSATSGDKSRTSSGIGYKTNQQNSSSGTNGRRRLIFQRETTTEAKEPDSPEKYHKAYVNQNQNQKPKFLQRHVRPAGQAQSSVHLPKNTGVAVSDVVNKQYGIVKKSVQNGSQVSKSQDKNQKMLRQIIDQQKSKFADGMQSSQNMVSHAALRSQQLGSQQTSGTKADFNNFHPLGSLEFVRFIEQREGGSADSQQRKEEQSLKQDTVSNQAASRGVVGMRKISKQIIQGQKTGRQIKQILQNSSNVSSATKRTNLRSNLQNVDGFPRFKGVTKVQAPTQILQSTNLNDNITYYSGHQSITLKALQSQKQGSYDTNPSVRSMKKEQTVIESKVDQKQALHEIKEQKKAHKQKLDDIKSQRSVNNMSRFKSQPSIGNIQHKSGSVKQIRQIKGQTQSTQDEILIQQMPDNFEEYQGYHHLSQPQTHSIAQHKQQLSTQTARTKSVRQISEDPQQYESNDGRFKNKGRRHKRIISGASNYDKDENSLENSVRRSREQNKLSKRISQRSSVGHMNNIEEERLAQSSGMGVIAESSKDQNINRLVSNQHKTMVKQKSHVVLSPMLISNKEHGYNVKQESHLLYMNQKETIETVHKNINSIQLRSARNLPEIKSFNTKRDQNYNIVKILKVDNKEIDSPERLKNQRGIAKMQAQNLKILQTQTRASQEKYQVLTSRAIDKQSIQMPKQLQNKHSTSTTPATPIGGASRMQIQQGLVEKQKHQQKYLRKNKDSKTELQMQEARLDKLIYENNQILKKKPYENVKTQQQQASSTETEKRQPKSGSYPYRNQARKLTKPADAGLSTERREFQECSGTSLRKTTKPYIQNANENADTCPRQKKDNNEYQNIMKSDESVVFYKNEELPPEPKQQTPLNIIESPEQQKFSRNRLSQLSSIKKNSSQKKGVNLSKSLSPIAQDFQLNVKEFNLEHGNPHEKPSIIFESRGEQPAAIMLEQFQNDLDIKGQQMSEIPKNTITNKDFDQIIDNLDEKFQLFSEQNSITNHENNVIPKNVERLRDLRAKKQKQPFSIFASQEMTPIKKSKDNLGQIEDLEALCEGLDGIVVDSNRERNKQSRIQIFLESQDGKKPVQTVQDEVQDIRFIDQQNSLSYSQKVALAGINYNQSHLKSNQGLYSPKIPASESSVNLLLKLQNKKKKLSASLRKSLQNHPIQQDINPLSFYASDQHKNENDMIKNMDNEEIIQVRPSAERLKKEKEILQQEFELKVKKQVQYIDLNRQLKTVLENERENSKLTSLQKRSNKMSIEVPNMPPGAGDLMSPSCNDVSAAESNNKQALFLMSIQRSQTSNMFNEVENFFPPTDLCFGLEDSSYLKDDYNNKIDQIQLINDSKAK